MNIPCLANYNSTNSKLARRLGSFANQYKFFRILTNKQRYQFLDYFTDLSVCLSISLRIALSTLINVLTISGLANNFNRSGFKASRNSSGFE